MACAPAGSAPVSAWSTNTASTVSGAVTSGGGTGRPEIAVPEPENLLRVARHVRPHDPRRHAGRERDLATQPPPVVTIDRALTDQHLPSPVRAMPGHDDQMGTRAGPPHHAHPHSWSGCRLRRGLDIDRPDPRGITPHRPRRQSHRLGLREMGHRRGQLETVRDVLKLQARRRTRLGQLVPQRRLTRRPRIQRSQHRGAHHHRTNCQHRARQTPAPPQPPNQQPTTLTRATHPHRSSGEGPARSGTALHAGRAAHPRGAQQARGSECGLTQHAQRRRRGARQRSRAGVHGQLG